MSEQTTTGGHDVPENRTRMIARVANLYDQAMRDGNWEIALKCVDHLMRLYGFTDAS